MSTYLSVKLMKAMFTVHTYLFMLPLPVPWESVCVNGTEHQRTFQLRVAVTVSVETMNHRRATWDELWQHLACHQCVM